MSVTVSDWLYVCRKISPILLQFVFGLPLPLFVGAIHSNSTTGRGTTHRRVLDG